MPKLASPARSAIDYPMTQADAEAHRKASHVRENHIVEEPATIAACRSDYESAAESRAAFARQQRTRR